MACTSSFAAGRCAKLQCRAPVLPVRPASISTSSRRCRVQAEAQPARQVPLAAATAAISAAGLAVLPAAHAVSETAQMAALVGEPLVSQIGWGAVAAVFTFSLSLVVWGRSGL